ncbi:hypothetical protein DFA_08428 [Cavenderia fasciculata]|uniref:EGF-like domain-containing protein n=1 Tax=Cavenderia fasciculata TaxID=261658 RepID=F4Q659_CACFS|nr:uncharacterized protein DFA_08428 [Cavenderia fasciculata]EGG17433.1 hypothetical protein DFA_08428 [Cavenderia fasciculata]|eukprot:XP_004355917.1 hypothetical protein DFA_08428 [Cavenderia fasciculata]
MTIPTVVNTGAPLSTTVFNFPELISFKVRGDEMNGYIGDINQNTILKFKDLPKLLSIAISSDKSFVTVPSDFPVNYNLTALTKVDFGASPIASIPGFFNHSSLQVIQLTNLPQLTSITLDSYTRLPKAGLLIIHVNPVTPLTLDLQQASIPLLYMLLMTNTGSGIINVNLNISNSLATSFNTVTGAYHINAIDYSKINELALYGITSTVTPDPITWPSLRTWRYFYTLLSTYPFSVFPPQLLVFGLINSAAISIPTNIPLSSELKALVIAQSQITGPVPWEYFENQGSMFFIDISGNPGITGVVPPSMCSFRLYALNTGITDLPDCFYCYKSSLKSIIQTDLSVPTNFQCNITITQYTLIFVFGKSMIQGHNIGYGSDTGRFKLDPIRANELLTVTDSIPPPTPLPMFDVTIQLDASYPQYNFTFSYLEVGFIVSNQILLTFFPQGRVLFSIPYSKIQLTVSHVVSINESLTLLPTIVGGGYINFTLTTPNDGQSSILVSNDYFYSGPLSYLYTQNHVMLPQIGSDFTFSGLFGSILDISTALVYFNGDATICKVVSMNGNNMVCRVQNNFKGGVTAISTSVDGFTSRSTYGLNLKTPYSECQQFNTACQLHGQCNIDGQCQCDTGYYGVNCTIGYPKLTSGSYVDNTTTRIISLFGDFSLEPSNVTITVNGTWTCTPLVTLPTMVNCTIQPIPTTTGLVSVDISVNGSTNNAKGFILFRPIPTTPSSSEQSLDSSSSDSSETPINQCPNNCFGHGECINSKCKCFEGYNVQDNCLTKIINNTITPNTTAPTTSFDIDGVDFQFEIVAIQEIDVDSNIVQELLTDKWNATIYNDTQTTTVNYQLNTTSTTVAATTMVSATISFSSQPRDIPFGLETLHINANSIKVSVNISDWQYQSFLTTLRVIFKTTLSKDQSFEFDCQQQQIDSLQFDQLSSSIQYLRVVKDNIQFTGRFIDYVLSDGRPSFSKTYLINQTDNQDNDQMTTILIGISTPQCQSCILDPDFTPLLIDKSEDSGCEKKSNAWRIAVGVSIGGAALLAAAFVVFKYRYNIAKKAKAVKSLQRKLQNVLFFYFTVVVLITTISRVGLVRSQSLSPTELASAQWVIQQYGLAISPPDEATICAATSFTCIIDNGEKHITIISFPGSTYTPSGAPIDGTVFDFPELRTFSATANFGNIADVNQNSLLKIKNLPKLTTLLFRNDLSITTIPTDFPVAYGLASLADLSLFSLPFASVPGAVSLTSGVLNVNLNLPSIGSSVAFTTSTGTYNVNVVNTTTIKSLIIYGDASTVTPDPATWPNLEAWYLTGEQPWSYFTNQPSGFKLVLSTNQGITGTVPASMCPYSLQIYSTGITALPDCYNCYFNSQKGIIATSLPLPSGFQCPITIDSFDLIFIDGYSTITGKNIGYGNNRGTYWLTPIIGNSKLEVNNMDYNPYPGPGQAISIQLDSNYPAYKFDNFTEFEVGIKLAQVFFNSILPEGKVTFRIKHQALQMALTHYVSVNGSDPVQVQSVDSQFLYTTLITPTDGQAIFNVSNNYTNYAIAYNYLQYYPLVTDMFPVTISKIGTTFTFQGNFGNFLNVSAATISFNGDPTICIVTALQSNFLTCIQAKHTTAGPTIISTTIDGFTSRKTYTANIIETPLSQCQQFNTICQLHGQCNIDGLCECNTGYYGANCTMGYPKLSSGSYVDDTPTKTRIFALYGDFSIAPSNVTVNINGTWPCTTIITQPTLVTCVIQPIPTTIGLVSVDISVNGSTNNAKDFILFRHIPTTPSSSEQSSHSSNSDSSEVPVNQCPNKCFGHGECINSKCKCFEGYSVEDNCLTKIINNNTITPNTTAPTTSFDIDGVDFQFEIVAIQEIDVDSNIVQELLTDKWNATIYNDTQTTTVNYQLNTTSTTVAATTMVSATISFSSQPRDIPFGLETLHINANSIKVSVNISDWQYQSFLTTLRVIFKTTLSKDQSFEFDCQQQQIDSLQFDQLSSSIQYLRVVKDNIQFTGRFIDYVLSDGRPSFSKTYLINSTKSTNDEDQITILIGISTPQCQSCILDPDFTPLLIDKSEDSGCEKKSNAWRIAVGVSIGGAALIVAAVIVIKYKLLTAKKAKAVKSLQRKLQKFEVASAQWVIQQYGLAISPPDEATICAAISQFTCTIANGEKHITRIAFYLSTYSPSGAPTDGIEFDFPELQSFRGTANPSYIGDVNQNSLLKIKNLRKLTALELQNDLSITTIPADFPMAYGLDSLASLLLSGLPTPSIPGFFNGSSIRNLQLSNFANLQTLPIDQYLRLPNVSYLTLDLGPPSPYTIDFTDLSFPALSNFVVSLRDGVLNVNVNLSLPGTSMAFHTSNGQFNVNAINTTSILSLKILGTASTVAPDPATWPNLETCQPSGFKLILSSNQGITGTVPASMCPYSLQIYSTGISALPDCYNCYFNSQKGIIATSLPLPNGFVCDITIDSFDLIFINGMSLITGQNIGYGNSGDYTLVPVIGNSKLEVHNMVYEPYPGPKQTISIQLDSNYPAYKFDNFTAFEVGIHLSQVSVGSVLPEGKVMFRIRHQSLQMSLIHYVSVNGSVPIEVESIDSQYLYTTVTTPNDGFIIFNVSNNYTSFGIAYDYRQSHPYVNYMNPVTISKIGTTFTFQGFYGYYLNVSAATISFNGDPTICIVTGLETYNLNCTQVKHTTVGPTIISTTVGGFTSRRTYTANIKATPLSQCLLNTICQLHGQCDMDGQCLCDTGYYGANCTMGYPKLSSGSYVDDTPTKTRIFTLYGDFSNAPSNVTIMINGTWTCTPLVTLPTMVNCTIQPIPTTIGLVSVDISVNGSTNNAKDFILFRPIPTTPSSSDSSSDSSEVPVNQCPNNCFGHGECVNSKCKCFEGYNVQDNCLTKIINNNTITPNTTAPTTSFDIDGVDFQFEIVAIQEIDVDNNIVQELLTDKWNATIYNDTQTTTVNYQLNTTSTTTLAMVSATISFSSQPRDIPFGLETLHINANSIKVSVNISDWQYQSFLTTLRVIFKTTLSKDQSFEFDCQQQQIDSLQFQLSSSIQYLRVVKDNIQFTGRFIDYVLSDGRPSFSKTYLINQTDNQDNDQMTTILIGISTPQCQSCILDPDFTPLLIDKSEDSGCEKKSNAWRIAVGVSIGGAALIVASVIVIKYRLNVNKTKKAERRISQKLKALN